MNLPAAVLGSNIEKIGSARAKDVNTADDSRSSGSILGSNIDVSESGPDVMKGINKVNFNPADVVMGSNMAIISEPEPKTKPVQSASTKLTDKNITVNSVDHTVSTNVASNITAKPKQDTIKIHHKRKAKPHGKHFWPPSTSASTSKSKAESTKPCFIMVIHGLKKSKKHRKFRCKLCQNVADSQANANKHYKDTHPPVNCQECAMVFSNPSSLCQHKYTHLDKKFCCRNCNKYFLFESNLAGHRLKHRHHPGFQCNHSQNGSVCGKWYFAKSDLAKHVHMHSGKVYSCYECDYTTIDIRYLRAHRYTHSDKLKYTCKNCKEMFKHHTQMQRHEEKCKDKSRI